jgi:hypothetical protein
MKHKHIACLVTAVASILILGMTLAAEDRYTVTSPNGISFSEFKGYDSWQVIAPSQPDGAIKVILGNPAMIKAYNDGFLANGQPVPDGAVMAKIQWSAKSNTLLPSVNVPDVLKKVQFMVKDAKRFPDTDGWGYADFSYDAPSDSFKPMGNGASFAKASCHQCHTRVKARDFVFTSYAAR